jgi:hypothetical protein
MIEIQRQQAASAVYETFLPATACVSTLNAPSTRTASSATIARGHRVKDASQFTTYASANATAVMWNPRNAKPVTNGISQIKNQNCLAPVLMPANGVMPATYVNQLREINDTIVQSTMLPTTDVNYRKEDVIMAARQAIGPNCCATCGKVSWREGKVNFASTCTACKGVNAGDTNADGTRKFKSAYIYPTAVS